MKKEAVLLNLAFLLVLLASGCEQSVSGSNFNVMDKAPVPEDSIAYLALGDSYTIGQSVSPVERWPNQLVNALKVDGYKVSELRIIAQTGWTTTNLLSAIESADLEQYDLVSLLIGVNNQYQSRPFELFEAEFEILLNKAIDLAGGIDNVFVVSIPDYGVTPFGSNNSLTIARELDEYNAHMEEQCLLKGIPFIDITSISRMLGAEEGALAPDNLHPSGEQYKRWVESIYPVVKALLAE